MCKGSIQHYAAVIDQISDPTAGQALGPPIPGVPCPIPKARTSAPPSSQALPSRSRAKAVVQITTVERLGARAEPLKTAKGWSQLSSAPTCSPTSITCSNALNTAPFKTDAGHKQRITPSCARCFAWRPAAWKMLQPPGLKQRSSTKRHRERPREGMAVRDGVNMVSSEASRSCPTQLRCTHALRMIETSARGYSGRHSKILQEPSIPSAKSAANSTCLSRSKR